MEPTIYSEDVILTEHITPHFNGISRGDVIIARSPANPHHHICKRVTGLEGDKVKDGFKTHYVSFLCPYFACFIYCTFQQIKPPQNFSWNSMVSADITQTTCKI